MKTIFKYTLSPDDAPVEMPVGAEVLTAREQGENICVWARVETTETLKDKRTFKVFGTGHEIPDDPNFHYVGTAMLQGGGLVMHVFENRFAQ